MVTVWEATVHVSGARSVAKLWGIGGMALDAVCAMGTVRELELFLGLQGSCN